MSNSRNIIEQLANTLINSQIADKEKIKAVEQLQPQVLSGLQKGQSELIPKILNFVPAEKKPEYIKYILKAQEKIPFKVLIETIFSASDKITQEVIDGFSEYAKNIEKEIKTELDKLFRLQQIQQLLLEMNNQEITSLTTDDAVRRRAESIKKSNGENTSTILTRLEKGDYVRDKDLLQVDLKTISDQIASLRSNLASTSYIGSSEALVPHIKEKIQALSSSLTGKTIKDLLDTIATLKINLLQSIPSSPVSAINTLTYPSEITLLKPNESVAISCQGDAMALLRALVRFGIAAWPEPSANATYLQLANIYEKKTDLLSAEDIQAFETAITSLEIKDQSKHLRLLGKVLASEGKNDLFTLMILDKLRTAKVPYVITLSSHDASFIAAYEKNQHHKLDDSPEFLLDRSLLNLRTLLKKDLFPIGRLDAMITQAYFEKMELINYSVSGNTLTLYTSPAMGFDIIKTLATQFHIAYVEEPLDKLTATIDSINELIRSYIKQGKLTEFFNIIDGLPPEKSVIREAIWNRVFANYLLLNRWKSTVGTTQLKYVHLSDSITPIPPTKTHITNLGGPGAISTSGTYIEREILSSAPTTPILPAAAAIAPAASPASSPVAAASSPAPSSEKPFQASPPSPHGDKKTKKDPLKQAEAQLLQTIDAIKDAVKDNVLRSHILGLKPTLDNCASKEQILALETDFTSWSTKFSREIDELKNLISQYRIAEQRFTQLAQGTTIPAKLDEKKVNTQLILDAVETLSHYPAQIVARKAAILRKEQQDKQDLEIARDLVTNGIKIPDLTEINSIINGLVEKIVSASTLAEKGDFYTQLTTYVKNLTSQTNQTIKKIREINAQLINVPNIDISEAEKSTLLTGLTKLAELLNTLQSHPYMHHFYSPDSNVWGMPTTDSSYIQPIILSIPTIKNPIQSADEAIKDSLTKFISPLAEKLQDDQIGKTKAELVALIIKIESSTDFEAIKDADKKSRPYLAFLDDIIQFRKAHPDLNWIDNAGILSTTKEIIEDIADFKNVEKTFYSFISRRNIVFSNMLKSPNKDNAILYFSAEHADWLLKNIENSFADCRATIENSNSGISKQTMAIKHNKKNSKELIKNYSAIEQMKIELSAAISKLDPLLDQINLFKQHAPKRLHQDIDALGNAITKHKNQFMSVEERLTAIEKRMDTTNDPCYAELQKLFCDPAARTKIKKSTFEKFQSLYDRSSDIVANTLLEMNLTVISEIDSYELYNYGSSDPQPTMQKIPDQFNKIQAFIVNDILKRSSIDERTLALEHWIRIAEKCLHHPFVNNLNLLYAINSAFQHSSIIRLKATHAGISQHARNLLQDYVALTSDQSSYKNHREYLNSHPGSVPYFGLYKSDLTFYAVGNPTVEEFKWSSYFFYGKILDCRELIQKTRTSQFTLPTFNLLKEMVNNTVYNKGTEDAASEISLRYEPRNAPDTLVPSKIISESKIYSPPKRARSASSISNHARMVDVIKKPHRHTQIILGKDSASFLPILQQYFKNFEIISAENYLTAEVMQEIGPKLEAYIEKVKNKYMQEPIRLYTRTKYGIEYTAKEVESVNAALLGKAEKLQGELFARDFAPLEKKLRESYLANYVFSKHNQTKTPSEISSIDLIQLDSYAYDIFNNARHHFEFDSEQLGQPLNITNRELMDESPMNKVIAALYLMHNDATYFTSKNKKELANLFIKELNPSELSHIYNLLLSPTFLGKIPNEIKTTIEERIGKKINPIQPIAQVIASSIMNELVGKESSPVHFASDAPVLPGNTGQNARIVIARPENYKDIHDELIPAERRRQRLARSPKKLSAFINRAPQIKAIMENREHPNECRYSNFSNLIAACLLVGNFNPHFGITTDLNSSLVEIEHASPLEKLSDFLNPPESDVVNGLAIYPREWIINSKMADALLHIAKHSTDDLINSITKAIDEVQRYYGPESLLEFAKYTGLEISSANSAEISDSIKIFLSKKIARRQKECLNLATDIKLNLIRKHVASNESDLQMLIKENPAYFLSGKFEYEEGAVPSALGQVKNAKLKAIYPIIYDNVLKMLSGLHHHDPVSFELIFNNKQLIEKVKQRGLTSELQTAYASACDSHFTEQYAKKMAGDKASFAALGATVNREISTQSSSEQKAIIIGRWANVLAAQQDARMKSAIGDALKLQLEANPDLRSQLAEATREILATITTISPSSVDTNLSHTNLEAPKPTSPAATVVAAANLSSPATQAVASTSTSAPVVSPDNIGLRERAPANSPPFIPTQFVQATKPNTPVSAPLLSSYAVKPAATALGQIHSESSTPLLKPSTAATEAAASTTLSMPAPVILAAPMQDKTSTSTPVKAHSPVDARTATPQPSSLVTAAAATATPATSKQPTAQEAARARAFSNVVRQPLELTNPAAAASHSLTSAVAKTPASPAPLAVKPAAAKASVASPASHPLSSSHHTIFGHHQPHTAATTAPAAKNAHSQAERLNNREPFLADLLQNIDDSLSDLRGIFGNMTNALQEIQVILREEEAAKTMRPNPPGFNRK
jgi:hypothetical protein